jgi:hypothetical protein
VIREWNASTFANVVEYDGVMLRDLPVASGVEALTYQVGDAVLLEAWFPGGKRGELGIGTYWIKARLISPGSGAAEQAVAFMTTGLARALASAIFADRVRSDYVSSQTTTTSTAFGDGTSGGPTVVDIEISETGIALVWLGARIAYSQVGVSQLGGRMSVEVSGPTPIAASTLHSVGTAQSVTVVGATSWSHSEDNRVAAAHLFENLNPGLHTFAAKYQTVNSGQTAAFTERIVKVIGL